MVADTAAVWWVDDFLLTQKIVYGLEVLDGIYTTPPRKSQRVTVPGVHGQSWRPRTFDNGAFALNLWFGSDNQQDLQNYWRQFVRAATVTHRLPRYQRTNADGSTEECFGEIAEALAPKPEGQGFLWRAAVAVEVPSGFWQATADATVATVAGAALPQVLTMGAPFATASAPMQDLRFTVTGPISQPVVAAIDDLTGATIETWTYLGTLTTGQTLTFDSATWQVTGGGGFTPDPTQVRYTGQGRYLTVYPCRPAAAGPKVQLSGGNGGTGTKLSVTGRARSLV